MWNSQNRSPLLGAKRNYATQNSALQAGCWLRNEHGAWGVAGNDINDSSTVYNPG